MVRLSSFAVITFVFRALCGYASGDIDSLTSVSESMPKQQGDEYFNRNKFTLTHQDIIYKTNNQQVMQDWTVEKVVKCFDDLSIQRDRRPIHIAFVGDSTVRQHFLSFLRWLPNYDRQVQSHSTPLAQFYFHEDRNVTFPLMDNLLVSFRWRNLIKEDLLNDFELWAASNHTTVHVPDFILIGVIAHHIAPNELTSTLKEYEPLLERKLLPLMERSLSVHSAQEIIWLNESPTIDYMGPSAFREDRDVVYTKIFEYNKAIRHILRNSSVVVWDSINTVVEEYLRACSLTRFLRSGPTEYFICNDFIHPGYGALSIGTQLIFNHLCGKSESPAKYSSTASADWTRAEGVQNV